MVENARHNIETFVQQLVDTIDKMTELKQKTQPKLDALEQELKRAFTEQTTALTKEWVTLNISFRKQNEQLQIATTSLNSSCVPLLLP